jgi:hypothetical protein
VPESGGEQQAAAGVVLVTDAEVAALRADWLARWTAAGWPLAPDPVTAEHVVAVDRIIRDRLQYLRDDPSRDTWRSLLHYIVETAPGRSRWLGDCDDWGATVLDALDLTGVPADSLVRLLCSIKRDGVTDHYVGGCKVGTALWIVGDTLADRAYPASERTFDIVLAKVASDGLLQSYTATQEA